MRRAPTPEVIYETDLTLPPIKLIGEQLTAARRALNLHHLGCEILPLEVQVPEHLQAIHRQLNCGDVAKVAVQVLADGTLRLKR